MFTIREVGFYGGVPHVLEGGKDGFGRLSAVDGEVVFKLTD